MVCIGWMNDSAIENSCITKCVYRVLNKIINQSILIPIPVPTLPFPSEEEGIFQPWHSYTSIKGGQAFVTPNLYIFIPIRGPEGGVALRYKRRPYDRTASVFWGTNAPF